MALGFLVAINSSISSPFLLPNQLQAPAQVKLRGGFFGGDGLSRCAGEIAWQEHIQLIKVLSHPKSNLVGGWTNPFENMILKLDHYPK